MKIFRFDFEGMYPVGSCLIIAAENKEQAMDIASNEITHTDKFECEEIDISVPCVIEYIDGNY